MLKLKQTYIDIAKSDEQMQGAMAKACGRSFQSIKRWLETDDEKLTMFSVLEAIRNYLKLAKSVQLTEEVAEVNHPVVNEK